MNLFKRIVPGQNREDKPESAVSEGEMVQFFPETGDPRQKSSAQFEGSGFLENNDQNILDNATLNMSEPLSDEFAPNSDDLAPDARFGDVSEETLTAGHPQGHRSIEQPAGPPTTMQNTSLEDRLASISQQAKPEASSETADQALNTQLRSAFREQPAEQPQESEPDAAAMSAVRGMYSEMQEQTVVAKEPTPVVSQPSNVDITQQAVEVPAPSAGRAGRRSGRVKTRLLGFQHSSEAEIDPFAAATGNATARNEAKFPVGWIVVVEGPGLGSSFTLFSGVSPIGRGEDQAVKLDFGDTSISRINHALVAYDPEQRRFFLGHGGKANIVRLNDQPVLSTEEMTNSDLIRIGETTLRFVALCGRDFEWDADQEGDHVTVM